MVNNGKCTMAASLTLLIKSYKFVNKSPDDIFSLFSTINLINLFTVLASCGVVGHNKVENCSFSGNSLNPGFISVILAKKLSLVLGNLLQTRRKCCSVSKYFIGIEFDSSQVWFGFLSLGWVWQKTQNR